MTHYFKTVATYNQAEALLDELEREGVEREKVDIIVKQDNDIDVSEEALAQPPEDLDDAPEGTVSAFGAVLTPLAAMTAGILLAGTGPVAAAIGGGAVAAGGTALLMSGLGIPRDETETVINRLESGHVLVHVEDSNNDRVKEVFNRYH